MDATLLIPAVGFAILALGLIVGFKWIGGMIAKIGNNSK